MARFVGIALAALGLAAYGCAGPRESRRAGPVAQAQAMHERPSAPAPEQYAANPRPTPVAAVTAFGTAYVNWSAQTVSADMRELAARSIGQARSAMQLAAAQTASDYELQQGGIANSGAVEAVAPLRDQTDEFVVVTRELTTATATTAYQGLAPAWHVAVATVAQQPGGGWVVSGWQPES
jgi:hypothetical protein